MCGWLGAEHIDTSSLAIGVTLERQETMLEDTCRLRPVNNAQHINLTELGTVLKGISLALQWQGKVLHVKTDSCVCVYWVLDTLTGKARVYPNATNKMLIRRQLNTLKELVKEYELT